MKKTKNPYNFLEKYCLRTPTLSINFYQNIFTKEKLNYKKIKNIWQNELLQEAVFLASPYIHNELLNYFKKELNVNCSKNEKLDHTFLKYAIRSSTRCTPFGLFSSFSIGNFSKDSEIELKPTKEYKRITKYDTNYISSLYNYFFKQPIIKNQLLFFPNSTLYKITNQYRYIEYTIENSNRSYSIEGLEYNTYIEKILIEAKTGKSITQLAHTIVDDKITLEDANTFIESLIDNQILISELELNVTGDDPLEFLIKKLASLNETTQIVLTLELLQSHLTTIDKRIGNNLIAYKNCFQLIKKTGIPHEEKYIFQTDMFTKLNNNKLAIKHGYTIKKLLPLLNKLSPYKEEENLEHFKKAFLKRYETRKMPLTKVLDIELGIGYIQNTSISDTTPFLEDILPHKKVSYEEAFAWSEVDRIVYQKLIETKKNNQFILELTDKDFEHIDLEWSNTPDTLSAFTEIIRTNNTEHLFVYGASANAGNLLARFSYENTDLLKQITHLEAQMHPNKIIAEIVHLPKARTGNILKRPHLRNFEIPYLAKSTLPLSQQIPIDDLYISIQNNRVILTSKKHHKEVLPKLTNAHNYKANSLPIYHFLCDLQKQNTKEYLGFSWPKITNEYSFLPRVLYKNVILSKAKWHLTEDDIKIFNLNDDENTLLTSIKKWQKRFQVPKYIQLVESDNLLLIDLENYDSIILLLNTIKNKKQCLFEEFLFTEDTIVNRGNKKFTNECIITLYNQEKLNQINL